MLADWPGEGSEAAFLRDIPRRCVPFFDVALGPDYNDAHRDHLGFDRGSYRACR